MYEDGSDAGINGTFEIYRAEGDSLYKNGEFRKAITSFTTVCFYYFVEVGCTSFSTKILAL